MSTITRTFTFSDGTTAYGSQVESEISNIVTAFNNHNAGTSTWSIISVLNASSVPLVADNSTGTNDIVNFKDNGAIVFRVNDGGATVITATAGGSSVPLTLNNSTSTGSIFIAQDNGSAIMTIADGGNLTYEGPAVFNEAGADKDFRIEGDTFQNLFFIDASTDRIGINTSSPSSLVHIAGTVAGTETTVRISHSDNTDNGSSTKLLLITGGASGGDSVVEFSDNTTQWDIGLDNSASSAFVISTGGLGISNALSILASSFNVTFAGVLLGPDGAIGTPAFAFSADPDNGAWREGANSWSLSVGGARAINMQTGQLAFYVSGSIITTMSSSLVAPTGAGVVDFGNATTYWADISYKTLTDRGCLGWFDDGVELRDGSIVSDLEAILQIKKHPTKKTVYGVPMLDYRTFPKVCYKPADRGGVLIERDDNDEPVEGSDGIEMTSFNSILLGAIKELAKKSWRN